VAAHVQALLSTTDRVVQQIDSVEYGLTDIQEYYANTGALKAAAEAAKGPEGKRVGCSVVEAFGEDAKPRELEDVLRLEYRSKLLNPKWAQAMAAQVPYHHLCAFPFISAFLTFLTSCCSAVDHDLLSCSPGMHCLAARTVILDLSSRCRCKKNSSIRRPAAYHFWRVGEAQELWFQLALGRLHGCTHALTLLGTTKQRFVFGALCLSLCWDAE
jgi:hypothetical protein